MAESSNQKSYKKHPELFGIALFLFACSQLMSLLSFQDESYSHNLLGLFGHSVGLVWYTLFGATAIPLMCLVGGIGIRYLISGELIAKKKCLAALLATFSFCLLLTIIADLFPSSQSRFNALFESSFHLGGLPLYILYKKLPFIPLERLLNITGTAFFAIVGLVLSIGYLFEIQFQKALFWVKEQFIALRAEIKSKLSKKETQDSPIEAINRKKFRAPAPNGQEAPMEKKIYQGVKAPSLLSHSIELPPSFANIPESLCTRPKYEAPMEPTGPSQKSSTVAPISPSNYKIPSSELLNIPKKNDQAQLKSELKQKAELLEETLLSFGIEAKVGQIHSGPTITSFEVHPAVGVKVGRIKTLEHDIALNLEAKSIRIVAPIPGKAAVGIEVPNKQPQEVCFKELLLAYQQQANKFHIPMLLGKTVNGDFVMNDLAKMPHCIIAGATGSGKSVCINSIVMSILLTSTPDEVRLLMIDPKKVELTPYSELPHMLAPVITEPKAACTALNWLVKEMEKRYEMLKTTGQRNIEGFNKRKIDPDFENRLDQKIPEKLPYYVAIIDELADLMMVAASDIETPIARIAQMARAVGIHLILATQRPSREVITGLIKANFPARIAFKVASRVNSQIILDETGAETLLGNGDMLILPPGSSQLIRAQGVFVRDEEINRAIEQIAKQGPPQYIISSFDRLPDDFAAGDDSADEPNDTLFEEAKTTVLSTGNASTTFLQRKLKIGYARAASLMDELERKGIVGPQEGSKPRKIFFPKMSEKGMSLSEAGFTEFGFDKEMDV